MIVTSFNMQRPVEKSISSLTKKGRLPLISIGNHLHWGSTFYIEIPSMYVDDNDWQAVMEMTMALSSVIILVFENFSTGVTVELEAIKKLSMQNQTIIILHNSDFNSFNDELTGNTKDSVNDKHELMNYLSQFGNTLTGDDVPELLFPKIMRSKAFSESAQPNHAAAHAFEKAAKSVKNGTC